MLVGYSYGGAFITEAGTHDKVTALVYIAAFAPDKGESVSTLMAGPPGAPGSPILAPKGGFLFQDRARFPHSFGADLPAADAAFMADSQVPWGVDTLAEPATEPAWRSKPRSRRPTSAPWRSGPGATTVDVAASHAVYMSQPAAVAALIRQAAV